MVQTSAARLSMLVHIVVLNLAEIPVICVHQFHKSFRIAVIGEANLADCTAFPFLIDPLLNAQILHSSPCVHIAEHVHQVVINMIRPQALQLFLEELFQALCASNQVMRQFRCNLHLFPDSIFLQNLAQSRFAAGIDVCRVEIIDAQTDSLQNLPFCLFHIDFSHFLLKTHAAKAQNGYGISVFIITVVHGSTSCANLWIFIIAQPYG